MACAQQPGKQDWEQEVGQGCVCWPGARTPRHPEVWPLLLVPSNGMWPEEPAYHTAPQRWGGEGSSYGRVDSWASPPYSSQQDGKWGAPSRWHCTGGGAKEGGKGRGGPQHRRAHLEHVAHYPHLCLVEELARVSGQGTERAAVPWPHHVR